MDIILEIFRMLSEANLDERRIFLCLSETNSGSNADRVRTPHSEERSATNVVNAPSRLLQVLVDHCICDEARVSFSILKHG